MSSFGIRRAEFTSRYGILSDAVRMAAVRKELIREERIEMDKLGKYLEYSNSVMSIFTFIPGQISLFDNKLKKVYKAEYDENYVAVEDSLDYKLELKLFIIYYIRSLPLYGFEQDYALEQQAESGDYSGGLDAYGDLSETMPGFAEYLSDLDGSEDVFCDAEDGLNAEDEVDVVILDNEGSKGSNFNITVEDVLAGKLPNFTIGSTHVSKSTALANFDSVSEYQKELWYKALPKISTADECVYLRDVGQAVLTGEMMFSGVDIVKHYDVFPVLDDTVYDAAHYQRALVAPNTSDISIEQRRMILLGEAFLSFVYVANRVRQGWTVEEISNGKCIDLSTKSLVLAADCFFHKNARAYLLLNGSLKNKLRWYIASVLCRSEREATAVISVMFPHWTKSKYVKLDWEILRVGFCKATIDDLDRRKWSEFISSGGSELWFVGVMAELGDALLTYWLYKNIYRKSMLTQADMQNARSAYLSNEFLNRCAVGIGITASTVHANADRFEAVAAVILLSQGYRDFNTYCVNAMRSEAVFEKFMAKNFFCFNA